MLYASFRLHQALLKTRIWYLQEKYVSKTVSIYSLCPNMGTDSHINSRRGLPRGKRERPRFVFGKPWGLLSILIKRKQNHTQYHTQYHTSQLVFVALGIWYFIPRVNIGNPKLIETDCDPFWAHVQVVQYNIKSSNLPYPAILRMIKCQALSTMEFTVQPAVGLLKLW